MLEVKNMSLKEKLGQLLFVGFDGYEYNEHIRKLVEEYKVGNVILFVRNVKDLNQLSELNRTLHTEIKKHTGIMPLISIDQEGGMVTRIMKGATFCPGSMTLSSTNKENARTIGTIMGEELTRLGINMNLAPTLDVNNNPANPVIGVRSYGDNPEVVYEFGKEFIEGIQSQGIIATAKHFPGHGDTAVDSHLGLPVVGHSKDRLEAIELYPFKKLIPHVDAIMSAHIFFKAYEQEQLPATLSKKVLKDLLRNELGFKGLIVSDCMEMKAIDDFYTTAKGVQMGIVAGLDMAFISHTLEKQIKALELLEEAVLNGSLPMEELDEKVERILRYKEKTRKAIEENFINNPSALAYFEETKNKEIAQAIVDSSLTLVHGKRFLPSKKTLLLATTPFATSIAEDKLDSRNIIDHVMREIPSMAVRSMELNKVDESLLDDLACYDQVVVCTYNAVLYKEQARMVNLICAHHDNVYVLSTRNPYDYLVVNANNYACLYEYTPNSIRTIVKYLKGELAPKGKLPVRLERKFKISASLYVGLDEYSQEENIKYLHTLKSKGVDTVFISGHMPERNENFETELKEVLEVAKELGLKIIYDVNKKQLADSYIPEGIYALRLDYGFSLEDIIELSKKDVIIELNASVVTYEEMQYLRDRGVNLSRVRLSHNFYPKPYTGLTHEEVLRRNKEFKKLGLAIMAYIPSANGKRPPLKEGLPTIEAHRYHDIYSNLADFTMLEVDEVCFGDAYASTEELEIALNYRRDELVLPIKLVDGVDDVQRELIMRTHRDRRDEASAFIRSSIRTTQTIKPFNTVARDRFMVTIDNIGFMRYQGETSIMKENLGRDFRVNVVGRAMISDFLLDHIKPGMSFRFVVRGELK